MNFALTHYYVYLIQKSISNGNYHHQRKSECGQTAGLVDF